jgi:hypothetical protein
VSSERSEGSQLILKERPAIEEKPRINLVFAKRPIPRDPGARYAGVRRRSTDKEEP